VDIRIDPAASRRYLRALVEGMKTAPAGADPHRIAGMAGPREVPPPRQGRGAPPPEAAASELQAAGISPSVAQPETMKELRIAALSASLAQQEGRPEEAIQQQIKARDVAERAGMMKEATLMQLMLGGYLLQSGGSAQALGVFDEAAKRSKALGMVELEVQSHMARGGALLMLGRPLDSARAYGVGAQVAEGSPSKSLAVECYRMVGQILLANGHESEAATAWQRALHIAEGAPPVERVASSAPIAARELAALYRRHGLGAQADALENEVKRWEAEVPPPPGENVAPAAGATNGGAPTNGGPNGANGANGGAHA
jgi:tetratricopeptide (TPR) repeat protein